ncbi:hypothetical protein RMSM_01633 [Rhodopirellula maiorica SM1]|uniref:Uncharacterized protein n=1 Tax=Rhodopirellula maiorica SM1 TaxID=1265738 RepID=M5S1B6_9BACT|nr:hypothetical protein RMSM_01633 [Rhodopirellula maiorica SM1]
MNGILHRVEIDLDFLAAELLTRHLVLVRQPQIRAESEACKRFVCHHRRPLQLQIAAAIRVCTRCGFFSLQY